MGLTFDEPLLQERRFDEKALSICHGLVIGMPLRGRYNGLHRYAAHSGEGFPRTGSGDLVPMIQALENPMLFRTDRDEKGTEP